MQESCAPPSEEPHAVGPHNCGAHTPWLVILSLSCIKPMQNKGPVVVSEVLLETRE